MLNNEKFIFETEALDKITRPGIEPLLHYLANTDFYIAPCSGRYHGAVEGGLVAHSLKVYERIFELADMFIPDEEKELFSESLAVVSLFHDLCKVDFYEPFMRNVKNPDTGIWEQVQEYRVKADDKFACHGAKSCFIVMTYMELTPDEFTAILHHMGAWDKSQYSNPGQVYSQNKLAWLLHVADEVATYIDGV